MSEEPPTYKVVDWKTAIEEQERLMAAGIDPNLVMELRRQAIAVVRVCDEILDRPQTIPERQR